LAVAAPPPTPPANIGLGLRQMVENYHRDQAAMRANAVRRRSIQLDSVGRVVVNIHLDGKTGANAVAERVRRAGGEILAIDPNWRLRSDFRANADC
jgi:hypothetical protein